MTKKQIKQQNKMVEYLKQVHEDIFDLFGYKIYDLVLTTEDEIEPTTIKEKNFSIHLDKEF